MRRLGIASCVTLGALATPLSSLASIPPDTVVTLLPPDQRISVLAVFADATHYVQALMMLLLVAAVAALSIWGAVLVRPRTYARADRAVALLAAISAIAPMMGSLAGAYNLLHIFIGIANKRPAATIVMLAPGLAESALCVVLGFLAGTIAVAGRHHLSLLRSTGETTAASKGSASSPSRA